METSIDGAKGVLVNITGSLDIGLEDVETAASLVQEAAHPEANIIFGATFDETMETRSASRSSPRALEDKPRAYSLPSETEKPFGLGFTRRPPRRRPAKRRPSRAGTGAGGGPVRHDLQNIQLKIIRNEQPPAGSGKTIPPREASYMQL
jgi:hypothetical protein